MRPPITLPAVSLAALCLLVATGCADFALRARVEDTGMALRRHPEPVAAAAYAEALHAAVEARVYRADSTEFQRLANEALAALTAGEPTAGPDRPRLVAWRGLLLIDLGRNDQGRVELERSMAMRPTLVAARGIVPILRQGGRTGDVGQTCAASAAALTERDELFRLMELCAANAKAPGDAAGLSWATPEMRAFYDTEHARRQQAAADAAAAAELAAAEEATRMANQAAMDAQAAQIASQAAMDAASLAAQQAATPPPP